MHKVGTVMWTKSPRNLGIASTILQDLTLSEFARKVATKANNISGPNIGWLILNIFQKNRFTSEGIFVIVMRDYSSKICYICMEQVMQGQNKTR